MTNALLDNADGAGATPFQLSGPSTPTAITLASPHSGRQYPDSLLRRSRLLVDDLRRSEDALVDLLLAPLAGRYSTITATYGRCYVDLNRDPAELDADMFDPPLDVALLRASDRVSAGLGVLPRVARPGRAIYPGRLPASEAGRRIAEVHTPYHDRLGAVLAAARAAHGFAVLVDVHSMPPPPDAASPRFVLGDLHGRSAAPELVRALAALLRESGQAVALNTPYAGAYTLERHGRPAEGIHAVQLEIDRRLYLARDGLSAGRGFAAVSRMLTLVIDALADRLGRLPLGPAWAAAAE